jgi:predicted permease
MLDVFLTVILPVFLVAGAGAMLQRWRRLTVGTLSPVTVYVLSPALVFQLILNAEMPADTSVKLAVSGLLTTVVVVLTASIISVTMKQDRSMRSGFLLATSFPNVGNMGLPISLLAFGDAGLAAGVILFVTQAAIAWPLGIFIAARSQAHGLGPLVEALKLPAIYAVALGIVIRALGWSLPTSIDLPVEMLAAAAIPAMLLVLGFQMAHGIEMERWRALLAALFVRLALAAPIAYGVTLLLGIDGVSQRTAIIMAAMPAAVFPTLLATTYNAEPRFVSSSVIVSTIVSLGTLTILIDVLDRWLA